VRALIAKQTGELYHVSHVSRLLRGLGFSPQISPPLRLSRVQRRYNL
jgi:transposase